MSKPKMELLDVRTDRRNVQNENAWWHLMWWHGDGIIHMTNSLKVNSQLNSRREQGLKWNWNQCQNGSKKRAKWAFAVAPHVMAGRRDIYGMSNSFQVNSELTKQFQGQWQTKTSSIQRNSCRIHQGQSMSKARAKKKPQFKRVYHSWLFHFNLTGLPKSRWNLDKRHAATKPGALGICWL